MYFSVRTQQSPPAELVKMTNLGSLPLAMLEEFTDDDASKHPTAWGVLNWMKDLSIILLQDLAATIMEDDPSRDMAGVEREFMFMRTNEFKVGTTMHCDFIAMTTNSHCFKDICGRNEESSHGRAMPTGRKH